MTTRITIVARPLLIMAATLACPALVPQSGFGHGTPFSVGFDAGSGKISVTPDVYRNFTADEIFVVDEFGSITNDGTPGWDKGATLPSGARLSLRFQGPLRYWNPETAAGDPLPVPGASLSILAAGGSTQVAAESLGVPSGVTGTNPLFLAPFTSHHHVVWEILNPDTAGLYGLWASLESENPVAFNALPSDPFLVVLNWGISNETDYNTGVDRLAATAVPEPTTILLLVVATLYLAVWARSTGHRTSCLATVVQGPLSNAYGMSSTPCLDRRRERDGGRLDAEHVRGE